MQAAGHGRAIHRTNPDYAGDAARGFNELPLLFESGIVR